MGINPWRVVRALPELEIVWTDVPPDKRGFTDGRTVYMPRDLLQVERRCTVLHELTHAELGVVGCDSPDERQVRRLVARRLIPAEELCKAARWSTHTRELADSLWVTEDVLITRLEHLHPSERAALLRATAHHRVSH